MWSLARVIGMGVVNEQRGLAKLFGEAVE